MGRNKEERSDLDTRQGTFESGESKGPTLPLSSGVRTSPEVGETGFKKTRKVK